MISSAIISILSLGLACTTTLASPSLQPRATTLADGKSEQFGTLSNGVEWQATGILTQGCSFSGPTITDCYGISLSADPTAQLDPGFLSSPRQRVEFRVPSQSSGVTTTYTWKHYLDPAVGTSTHFFHLMQIFDEAANSPIVTLDAVKGNLVIDDNVRTPNCGSACPSTALTNYSGKTTLHTLKLTAGANGSMQYTVTDASTKAVILKYNVASGVFGSSTIYLKYGAYRATFSPDMTAVTAAAGDFSST